MSRPKWMQKYPVCLECKRRGHYKREIKKVFYSKDGRRVVIKDNERAFSYVCFLGHCRIIVQDMRFIKNGKNIGENPELLK